MRPPVMVQANAVGTVLKLVKDGSLATLLPSTVLREHKGLASVSVTPALPQRTVALLGRRHASRTVAAQAFETLLLEMIGEEGFAAA